MGNKRSYTGEVLPLRFGVYTFEKPSVMAKNFAPLLSILEESISDYLRRPVQIDCVIYRAYTNGHEGLLSGDVDFMRVGPASYVLLKDKRPGISLLAAEADRIQCVIFTRPESGIDSLEQLRGRAFAFGDRESTFGTHLAKAVLSRAGLRKGDLGGNSRHFGGHGEVADAVKSTEYAAGSANVVAIDWKFKELYRFTNVLRMPFVAKANIDSRVAEALKRALIAQGKYGEVVDREYDSLRDELNEASQFGD
jgi:phosphonate transport system substrate-binding protein